MTALASMANAGPSPAAKCEASKDEAAAAYYLCRAKAESVAVLKSLAHNAVGEQCDGGDLGGTNCVSLGHGCGALSCDASCRFDASGCVAGTCYCGNDRAEDVEACDGTDLRAQTCASVAPATPYGLLACDSSCTSFVTTKCAANLVTQYATSFEGVCPDGWTLTGDWQCGVPINVGPSAAFDGTQCLGTQIAGNYNDLQTWAGATATSPDIDLTAAVTATLTFRMWIYTEGSTYDGFHLQISTDGGASYPVFTNVIPAYPLTIGGEPAWGGIQPALGWQPVAADLTAYAGQTARLRFSFQSDSSGSFPGVYVDDIVVQVAN